jgi:hypothetical protein
MTHPQPKAPSVSEAAKPQTLLERAEWIKRSADRLARLVALNAPAIIIENERHILAKRVISFPAQEEEIQARESSANSTQAAEQAHLMATGYYDDVLRDIDGAAA